MVQDDLKNTSIDLFFGRFAAISPKWAPKSGKSPQMTKKIAQSAFFSLFWSYFPEMSAQKWKKVPNDRKNRSIGIFFAALAHISPKRAPKSGKWLQMTEKIARFGSAQALYRCKPLRPADRRAASSE